MPKRNSRMRHEDFRIATEFWCSGRRWRCTDIGTRVVVVSVCLEPHEVVPVVRDDRTSNRTITRTMTAGDSWLAGPPYAVPEEVFDEYCIGACTLAPDGEGPGAELTEAVDSLK
jgi:hypothetical protein